VTVFMSDIMSDRHIGGNPDPHAPT
jgi:hypothetical protein